MCSWLSWVEYDGLLACDFSPQTLHFPTPFPSLLLASPIVLHFHVHPPFLSPSRPYGFSSAFREIPDRYEAFPGSMLIHYPLRKPTLDLDDLIKSFIWLSTGMLSGCRNKYQVEWEHGVIHSMWSILNMTRYIPNSSNTWQSLPGATLKIGLNTPDWAIVGLISKEMKSNT